jgi:hypothetical protein
VDAEGKVLKQIGPCGFYARVWVNSHDIGQQPSQVTLDPSADDSWHRLQGWTDAALIGATMGMKLAAINARCKITRIHGMPCDTNPTLVAIAAIRAVWAALQFSPDDDLAARLEAAILRRSELDVADLEAEVCGRRR